ncbi:FAD-dependent oxidoreductase [Pseudomonas sp. 22-AL-CL-001]|uniref:flavin monoamine oxidase family protein n=1 Tax=Pseudomonas alabamensis TaxID=3064349 RepID=UPI0027131AD1|nr:NAD(P)/FAD-dependent oxidoreductase [Pseudomonas sp. 22-AL-CL-001]MDO7911224.1 FAD-dependent oxidoreductase [Pseudomonas sp. 22-AL-CL-001]
MSTPVHENYRNSHCGCWLEWAYAAYKLQQLGVVDYRILEARPSPGGRILTLSSAQMTAPKAGTAATTDVFDFGPSWFWPTYQQHLGQLVDVLGLSHYEQHELGDMLSERSLQTPVMRRPGYRSAPTSMRISGGMGALIDALLGKLDSDRILTGQIVHRLHRTNTGIRIESRDHQSHDTAWHATHVLLALPPRLAQATIDFFPPLSDGISRSWQQSATWMAPHAKYLATYETAFWRDQGLSGAGRSGVGPMAEIHDASLPNGQAALFGFIGIPATTRKTVGQVELAAMCRAQLARLFGPMAALPTAEFIKDWAADPFTAIEADWTSNAQHAAVPPQAAVSGPWADHLIGVGSEWSLEFPGYLAGAIDAVDRGIASLSIGKTLSTT